MMAEVHVTPAGAQLFEVRVGDPRSGTRHHVEVPDGFLASIGRPDVDEGRAVRATFEFLLEREPATSILPRFSLTTVTDYFPDFVDDLHRRLA